MIDVEGLPLFLLLLAVVAFLYASVGHGGASGYLMLMALWSFPVDTMRTSALVLNLFVAAASFLLFARKGHFRPRLLIAFAVASVPMAFLGGLMTVDALLYRKILGVLLFVAIARMLGVFGTERPGQRPVLWWQGVLVGATIGFLSGLIGIGGGIILGPVILLMRWGTVKEAATVSAAFIWVNSAAALAGGLSQGFTLPPDLFVLVGVAFTGGLLGAYFGSARFTNTVLLRTLASVLAIAGIKLLVS